MATGSVGNVFIMFASDPTARFVSVDIYGDDSVASLIKRFSVQCFLDAGHLDLFLIKVDGEDEPSEAEVSALRSPRLQVGWPLSRASIASGAWLLGRSTLAGSLLDGTTGRSRRIYNFAALQVEAKVAAVQPAMAQVGYCEYHSHESHKLL